MDGTQSSWNAWILDYTQGPDCNVGFGNWRGVVEALEQGEIQGEMDEKGLQHLGLRKTQETTRLHMQKFIGGISIGQIYTCMGEVHVLAHWDNCPHRGQDFGGPGR